MLADLPQDEREVLVLRFYADLKVDDIAAELEYAGGHRQVAHPSRVGPDAQGVVVTDPSFEDTEQRVRAAMSRLADGHRPDMDGHRPADSIRKAGEAGPSRNGGCWQQHRSSWWRQGWLLW